tara:strand:+ start:1250 stop:1993 length:744 start_codon:yes stop_codon:yes gene_type:complete
MFNNWIWTAYTPGSGGKLLCVLLQLDESSVDPWYDYSDIDQFINERFISNKNLIEYEPIPNVDVRWYTRQLPFTRGDDLTTEQAWNKWTDANKNPDNIVVVGWNKPYIPKWYNGRVLSLINDDKSMTWLKNRRDHLFFTWNENTVTLDRFLNKRGNNNKYPDDPETEIVYENRDDFYLENFYEDPEVLWYNSPKFNNDHYIMLDDMLNQDPKELIQAINENMNLDISMDKGIHLVTKWRLLNEKYYG